MGKNRRGIRAAALCLAVGALASCATERQVTYSGGTLEELVPEDEKRGRELAVEGMRLLKEAESVRMAVDMTKAARTRTGVLHMDRDGNCTGTYDMGPMERGRLIVVAGDAAYARYADESLDAIDAMAAGRDPEAAARVRERTALARGKYLKLPEGTGNGSGAATPTTNCDLDKLTGTMPGTPEEGETFKALDPIRRYGQDVIPLAGESHGQKMTLYVAADGEPYVVGVRQVGNGEAMLLRFSEYDEPVHAVAPPAEQTLDISRFLPEGGDGGSLFEV
ncbi:hypothetical protein ACFVYR_17855 [Streptomyces sp. NPDC058284]|uniref:hypothetical protein n=1 Tax=unclassified Streptomyces TaxID=2593676 RepID=UPI003669B116